MRKFKNNNVGSAWPLLVVMFLATFFFVYIGFLAQGGSLDGYGISDDDIPICTPSTGGLLSFLDPFAQLMCFISKLVTFVGNVMILNIPLINALGDVSWFIKTLFGFGWFMAVWMFLPFT